MFNFIIGAFIQLLNVIELLIFIRVVLSWFRVQDSSLIRILYQLTEPILAPLRTLQERVMAGRGSIFDFSPVIALILIEVVKNFFIWL